MHTRPGPVTEVLAAVDRGEVAAVDRLYELVYDELRTVARRKMAGEAAGLTLQPTALIHETYLRLLDGVPEQGWQNRRHFFAAAAETMRRILVEHARRRRRVKHGGHLARAPLDEAGLAESLAAPERSDDLLALDDALRELEREDPGKAELVSLRYFGGLTLDEAAQMRGISRATAARHWAYAKAWLFDRIAGSAENQKSAE